ncbi:unnamed protein product [Lepidochelys kempii]
MGGQRRELSRGAPGNGVGVSDPEMGGCRGGSSAVGRQVHGGQSRELSRGAPGAWGVSDPEMGGQRRELSRGHQVMGWGSVTQRWGGAEEGAQQGGTRCMGGKAGSSAGGRQVHGGGSVTQR